MVNHIRPSVRYFDHVFEELGVRKWSRAVILNSSKVCWRVTVTLVPESLKTNSVQSQFQFFQPLFGGDFRVDVRKPFPNYLYD